MDDAARVESFTFKPNTFYSIFSKSPSPYLPALLNTFLVTSLRACVWWCLSKHVNEIQYRNGTSGAFCKYFERRTSDQVRCVPNNQWRLHIGFSLPSFLCIKPANKVTHRTPLRTGYKVGGRNMATLSHPHWCEKKGVTSEQKVWHPCFNAVTLTNVCISMHTLSHTCNIASLLHNSPFSTPQVGSVSYQGVIVDVKLE